MFDHAIPVGKVTTRVAVRADCLRELGELLRAVTQAAPPTQVALITDQRVGMLYAEAVLGSLGKAGFRTSVYRITPGEASKSLVVAGELYDFLARHHVGRDGLVLALGGGVVSDLAGFVAATWMRGVRFAICPTTLEADIDAAIGGKTAVNIAAAKNLVGAFHQPQLVAIDPTCLKSLERRDVRAGLAESVKHALISSVEFLGWHEANAEALLALDPSLTTELILRNVRIKAAIVERDAHEQGGDRVMLNFGHTVGHAIEACCSFTLRHGECVGLGILAACRLSAALKLLDHAVVDRLEALLSRLSLPVTIAEFIDTDRIIATIRKDKKVLAGAGRYVLLEDIGKPVVRDDIPESAVRQAYESLLQ